MAMNVYLTRLQVLGLFERWWMKKISKLSTHSQHIKAIPITSKQCNGSQWIQLTLGWYSVILWIALCTYCLQKEQRWTKVLSPW